MTAPSWPHPWPFAEHCHWHDRHEPVPDSGAYIVCGECGHVYVTALELLKTFADEAPADHEIDGDMTAKDIMFCPLCLHDF